MTLQLDEIYASCLDTFRAEDVAVSPSEAGYDFWELCNKTRDAIHQLGFRLAEGQIIDVHTTGYSNMFILCLIYPQVLISTTS